MGWQQVAISAAGAALGLGSSMIGAASRSGQQSQANQALQQQQALMNQQATSSMGNQMNVFSQLQQQEAQQQSSFYQQMNQNEVNMSQAAGKVAANPGVNGGNLPLLATIATGPNGDTSQPYLGRNSLLGN